VGPELRAWTLPRGTRAPQAAGKIHTDMEEALFAPSHLVPDFLAAGSMAAARIRNDPGGRQDYIIQDGDILHIRFHV